MKEVTLVRQILEEPRADPSGRKDLSLLLTQIGQAGRLIGQEIRRAGLAGTLGVTGEMNVHGEEVKKLDELANQAFVKIFDQGGLVCTVVSEELEKPMHFTENCPGGKYTVFFDPLDGSSNMDVNGSVGSIFSIHHRLKGPRHGTEEEWFRVGSDQVAAGYVLYGPGTILVYTAGAGVHGFTLDPTREEFLLSHPNIRIPERGRTYSVNEAHSPEWHPQTREFVAYLKEQDTESGRPYSSRYVGALVADFHRTLLQGGVFLYPGDTQKPQGKLRLLYEAAPLAFVAEQAGGRASTGRERILDIRPTDPHQRVPLLIGSPEEVTLAEAFERGRGKGKPE